MFRRGTVDAQAREAVSSLDNRVRDLEKRLRTLEDFVQELNDKHVRLRGKVYAHKLHKDAEDAAPTKESKADLLRKAGFTPGKPMVHPPHFGVITMAIYQQGMSQQTPAVQQLLRTLAPVRGVSRRKKKRSATNKSTGSKRKKSASASRGGKQKRFVKGSPEAKRFMAKLRKMRKK